MIQNTLTLTIPTNLANYRGNGFPKSMTNEYRQYVAALRRKMEDKGMRASELSRRTRAVNGKRISKQNISRVLNEIPHPVTGAPARATEDFVVRTAEALDWDVDEALLLAGFAPKTRQSNYQREMAALFRGAEHWSDKKRRNVLRLVEGLVESIESEEDE